MSGISGYGLHSIGTFWASARNHLYAWTPSFSSFSRLGDYFQSSAAHPGQQTGKSWAQSFFSGFNRLRESASTLVGSLSSCWKEGWFTLFGHNEFLPKEKRLITWEANSTSTSTSTSPASNFSSTTKLGTSELPKVSQTTECLESQEKTARHSPKSTDSTPKNSQPRAKNFGDLPEVTEQLGLKTWQEKFYDHFKKACDGTGGSPEEKEQALKKAYRTLVRRYHPDKYPGKVIDLDVFKALAEAYEAVGKGHSLSELLTGTKAAGTAYNSSDLFSSDLFSSDLFSAFFGDFSQNFGIGPNGANSFNRHYYTSNPDAYCFNTFFDSSWGSGFEWDSYHEMSDEPLKKSMREREEKVRVKGFVADRIKSLKEIKDEDICSILSDFTDCLSSSNLAEAFDVKAKDRRQERIDEVRQLFQEPKILSRLKEVKYEAGNLKTINYNFEPKLGRVYLMHDDEKVYQALSDLYGTGLPLPPEELQDFIKTEHPDGSWTLKRKKKNSDMSSNLRFNKNKNVFSSVEHENPTTPDKKQKTKFSKFLSRLKGKD